MKRDTRGAIFTAPQPKKVLTVFPSFEKRKQTAKARVEKLTQDEREAKEAWSRIHAELQEAQKECTLITSIERDLQRDMEQSTTGASRELTGERQANKGLMQPRFRAEGDSTAIGKVMYEAATYIKPIEASKLAGVDIDYARKVMHRLHIAKRADKDDKLGYRLNEWGKRDWETSPFYAGRPETKTAALSVGPDHAAAPVFETTEGGKDHASVA